MDILLRTMTKELCLSDNFHEIIPKARVNNSEIVPYINAFEITSKILISCNLFDTLNVVQQPKQQFN